MTRLSAYILCLLTSCSICQAGEIIESYVNYDNDHYLLHLDMRVNGKSDVIYAILIDFDHIPEINDTIVYSKVLESKNRIHRVHFESEGCVWFFCRRIKQVVTVTELGNGYIMSETDAEKGNMRYGRTLWQVIDEGKTTRIKYNADYVPDFWVPPIFGPIIFQNRMLEEGQKTINGIERLANKP